MKATLKLRDARTVATAISMFTIALYLMLGEYWTTLLSILGATFYAGVQVAICYNEKFAERYYQHLLSQPFIHDRWMNVGTNWAFVICSAWLFWMGWMDAFFSGLIIMLAFKVHSITAGAKGALAVTR